MNYIDSTLFDELSNLYDPTKEQQEKTKELKQSLEEYISTLDKRRQTALSNPNLTATERLVELSDVSRVVLNTFIQNFELHFKNNPYQKGC